MKENFYPSDLTGQPKGPAVKQETGVRGYIGFTLISLGILIGLWVFVNTFVLFNNPSKIGLFREKMDMSIETITSSAENVKMLIPPQFLAYIIPLFLLMICLGVAGVFITGGVNLICGDIKKILAKITEIESYIKKK
ncbi:hypothetical protein M0R36_01880 [bacterium]|jgi:hypothetical protein|nr:hypothetical protein [bacterium]